MLLGPRRAARRTDTVLATRVEKSVLDPYIALANTLGLRLCTIDLAQGRADSAGAGRCPSTARRTFILLVFEGETFSASLFENGQYKYATRGRLFHPRGTAESAAEILQKVSGMAQFQKTGANAPALTDLYFGGAAAGDLARLRGRGGGAAAAVRAVPAQPACAPARGLGAGGLPVYGREPDALRRIGYTRTQRKLPKGGRG